MKTTPSQKVTSKKVSFLCRIGWHKPVAVSMQWDGIRCKRCDKIRTYVPDGKNWVGTEMLREVWL